MNQLKNKNLNVLMTYCACGCGRPSYLPWFENYDDGIPHPDRGYAFECGIIRWKHRFEKGISGNT